MNVDGRDGCIPQGQGQCVYRYMGSLTEGMLGGLLGPQGWPLSGAELAASADSGTFPGVALRQLETAASLGWQPCGQPLALPGMTPHLASE